MKAEHDWENIDPTVEGVEGAVGEPERCRQCGARRIAVVGMRNSLSPT
jgi:hypothetical protein